MLSLTAEAGGGHGDLVLRLGDGYLRFDSYYLLLDDSVEERGPDRRSSATAALLTAWAGRLGDLRAGGVVDLPVAFFDQCVGWLRCRDDGAVVTVTLVWSSDEGYSFAPTQPDEWPEVRHTLEGGTEYVAPPTSVTSADLIAAIEASIERNLSGPGRSPS